MSDIANVTFLPDHTPGRLTTAEVMEVWDRVCGTNITPAVAARLWAFYTELKRVEDAQVLGHTPIGELGVSPRIHQLLMRQGIHTIEALQALNMGQILGIPGIGTSKFMAIREALGRRSRLRAA